MCDRIVGSVLLVLAGAASLSAADKPLKVFILAGQSNMQGHASVSTFDSLADDPKTAALLKEMRGKDGKPRVCEKVWITSVGCHGDAYTDLREQTGKLTVGYGAFGLEGDRIGPEYTFGLYMEKTLNEPILIIKTSWGGRSLHTDFRPPSGGAYAWSESDLAQKKKRGEDVEKLKAEKVKATGVYYREMIAHVQKILKDIKRVVPDYDPKQGFELAGFVWFQGFNDYVDGGVYPNQMKPGGYDLYAELLGHLIRDVRKDLSAPKMPFVIGVMGIDGVEKGEKPPMANFRAAQVKPTTLAEFKGNVVAVQTAPYWDDDLEELAQRMEQLNEQLDREFKKTPKLTPAKKEAARKEAIAEKFKPEELKRLKGGVSNGGYHYLGAAKILAPIGKAFAEELAKLNALHNRRSNEASPNEEDQTMTLHSLACRIVSLVIVAALANPATAAPNGPLTVPDFTKGAKIPKDAKHDWNLGPTGLRGWIFCDKMVTTDARQIFVTKVDKGSPAAGVFEVGDVILGVGGHPFCYDPRTELGKAITVAESENGKGKLTFTRWRSGQTNNVVLQLSVRGSYSATAPYDCPKSQRLLEQGCKELAARMANPVYADQDPIPRSLNALALLASGNIDYLPLVKKEAQWAAGFSSTGMQTWHYGYCIMLLSEYVSATGDQSVMPGLRRLAMEAAKGQSAVGSWGHGFAIPDGRLGGYGMMNSPGLVLTISLVMAREAGVKDQELARAIERSARLLRFYIGKGAIPYGDHHPWIESHDDNGKCGMAAMLFNFLDEAKGAEFFSRMSTASHGAERDCGHTGNYFNILWALPGVAPSGPNATGAWMKEFGSWYFDLARRWDGSYLHQGPPENEEDSYEGWDSTGGYLLAYAMPLKKIDLTGKRRSDVPQLDVAASQALINDGRGWDNKDRNSAYDKLSADQLMERLGSWSPVVRERAAKAMARRKETPISPLLKMLESPRIESRYGACQALIALRQRGAPAVDTLRKSLTDKDLWLRIKAAEALASIGTPAKQTVPQLLELLAQVDKTNDPRGMQQRYLSFALFDDGGILRGSLDGVDREALYKAVRAGLKNQDGRARGSIGSVYRNLSAKDIEPLLPAIHQAIIEPAPSGEMFADSIRVEGLRLFAEHRIEEGIRACVQYTRDQNPWDSQERTPELMKILLRYGTHAKSVVPELKKIADYFEKDEPNFPPKLMAMKAKCVREAIRAIETTKDAPELIRLKTEVRENSPLTDPAKTPDKPVKVFILAGQSNMEGQGIIKADPKRNEGKGTLEYLTKDKATADKFKHLLDKKGDWAVREDVWIHYLDRKGKLTVGYGAKEDRIGPELGFGHVIGEASEEPVLLIKLAWGGKSLAKDFRPPSSGGEVGPYYKEIVERTKAILKDVKKEFPEFADRGYEIAGFGWHQGWNDRVNQAFNDEYEKNMANFIRDIRKDLGVKDLPFVIAETGMTGPEEKHPRALSLMKAQAAVAEYAEFKGNVAFVGTKTFWRDKDVSPSGQGYHWNTNAETYYLIGDAMGHAMKKLCEPKPAK